MHLLLLTQPHVYLLGPMMRSPSPVFTLHTLVEFTLPNVHVMNIFQMLPLGHIWSKQMHLHFFLPPPAAPHTHPLLATATPPGRVKIDSLASSTRQLRAICSHLGCSSSFCFCDCSSNIIGLKVLERRKREGVAVASERGTQKWGVAWRGINRI